jgi:hypothetical protein
MASQTVRYARVRAAADPDREDGPDGVEAAGVYYGRNIPRHVALSMPVPEFISAMWRERTTRGACH